MIRNSSSYKAIKTNVQFYKHLSPRFYPENSEKTTENSEDPSENSDKTSANFEKAAENFSKTSENFAKTSEFFVNPINPPAHFVKPNMQLRKSLTKSRTISLKDNIYSRAQVWQEKKLAKLNNKRWALQISELSYCTFSPLLNQEKKNKFA